MIWYIVGTSKVPKLLKSLLQRFGQGNWGRRSDAAEASDEFVSIVAQWTPALHPAHRLRAAFAWCLVLCWSNRSLAIRCQSPPSQLPLEMSNSLKSNWMISQLGEGYQNGWSTGLTTFGPALARWSNLCSILWMTETLQPIEMPSSLEISHTNWHQLIHEQSGVHCD